MNGNSSSTGRGAATVVAVLVALVIGLTGSVALAEDTPTAPATCVANGPERISASYADGKVSVSGTGFSRLCKATVRVSGPGVAAGDALVETDLAGKLSFEAAADGTPGSYTVDALGLAGAPLATTSFEVTLAGAKVSLIVKTTAGANNAAVVQRNGGTEKKSIGALSLHVIEVPANAAEAMLNRYKSDAQVARAEIGLTRGAAATPNDPAYASQWNLPKVGYENVYGTVNPGGSAKIAVLDTGVSSAGGDISLASGWSAFGSDPTSDPNGHGTAVASIAAANTGNGAGVAGVSYANTTVAPVQVLDSSGTGQDADIIEGVVWAADNGADVILMSFANEGYSASLQEAIDYAWSHGAVLVAAAGNGGSATPMYPAGHTGVVGVSATDSADALWSGSTSGPAVFMAAPGVGVTADTAGGGTTTLTGTSASAAMVAGAAALLKANGAGSNATIVGKLGRSADAAGTQGETGNGRLNLEHAVADASTEGVTPAGAPGGGPYVGPYVIQSGVRIRQVDISSDSGFAFATDVAAVGQPIYARTDDATVGRGYKLELFNGAGASVFLSACQQATSVSSVTSSFTPTTISGGTSNRWKWVVHEWGTNVVGNHNGCTALPQSEDSDNTREFNVAKVTAYTDATLTTPVTSYSGSNSTVYVVVEGFGSVQEGSTDAEISWIKPDNTTVCENTGGGDRPDGDAAGRLPGTAGSYLQFPPGASGDPWNLDASYDATCGAGFSGSAGQWKIKVAPKDRPLQGFTTSAFTLNLPTVKLGFGAINGGNDPIIGQPFDVVVQSQEAGGSPQPVTANTNVTLSLGSGTGTLSGTLTGTILAGQSSVTISGVVYNKAETITLTATRTSGDSLTSGTSPPIDVQGSALIGMSTIIADGGTSHTVSLTQNTVAGAGVLILIYRQANNTTDSVTSITGPFTGSPTLIRTQQFRNNYYVYSYLAIGNGSGGTVTVNFASANRTTVIDLVQLAAGTTVVQSAVNGSSADTNPATVTLPGAANPSNSQVFFVGIADDRTVTATSPTGFTVLHTESGGDSGGYGTWDGMKGSASTTVSATLSGADGWGAISIELGNDTAAPSVTLEQASGQADPTNTSPINFTATFSEAVTGFNGSDVSLSGTAGATTAVVTGGPTVYNVAVSGMTSDGTVIASIPAGGAFDQIGNPNTASTSADNTVTYDATKPNVTIDQASGQADPTTGTPIDFTAVFTEPVTGFTAADVTVGGTAGATTAVVTGGPTTYNVAVSGMTTRGTVTASIPAGGDSPLTTGAQDAAGNGNTASSSTDNTVTWDRRPTATPQSPSTNEDTPVTITLTGSDPDGDPLTFWITSLPANGTLHDGTILGPTITTTPHLLVSGATVTYDPNANFNGPNSFNFKVNDDLFDSTADATVSITVTSVNDEPTLDPIADETVDEDAPQQTVPLAGISSGAANESQTLTVTASSSNTALVPDPTVNYTSPNAAGSLEYTPVADQFGTATITVTVKDSGGVLNGGDDERTRTFTITVTSVNDEPTLDPIADETVDEDAPQQTVPLAGISSGAANESQTLTVTASSSNTALVPDPTVNYTSPNAAGSLEYTPVADQFGTATITVTVKDSGGVLNGGDDERTRTFTITVTSVNDEPTLDPIADETVDEDAPQQTVPLAGISSGAANESQTLTVTASSSNTALVPDPTVNYTSPNAAGSLEYTPVADQFGTATITVTVKDSGGVLNGGDDERTRTFTITVTSVNDEPTLDPIADETVDEDAPQQTVPLAGISSGAANESQTLTVTASSSNTALVPDPTVNYTSPNAAGSLEYTPVADQFGTATITVTVKDSGGVLNGGDDERTRTFTITVTSVNDEPTLDPIADETVDEDAPQQTVPLAGISSGAANESQTLTVTASSSNTALVPDPTVNYTSPNAAGSLEYTPVADQFGTATITVTVKDSGGVLNGGDDERTRTFTITVTSVNDEPTLDPIADETVDEDAPQQTVPLAGISSGAANESQTLTVTASSSNTALVPDPTVNYTSPNAAGSLEYTPVADQFGTATITVTVKDSGGVLNGGDDERTRTFTITVTSVNDEPTLDPIADETVDEDAPQQTVPLAGISSGAANESQTLTVTASSSNTALVPDPTVNYTSPNAAGSLEYTPVADQFGTATITVTVKDSGGVLNGGDDERTRTFTITVTSVNDEPTLDPIADETVDEDAPQQTVPLAGISSGAANESQTLTVTASSSNTALVPDPTVNYTSPNAAGSLEYTPVADQFGTATITVTVKDSGGVLNGGDDERTRTFTITVTSVNDEPTLDPIADETVDEDAPQQTVPLAGISSGAANESQTLTVTASSSNTALVPDPTVNYTSPNAAGSLEYTPVADQFGTATITVTVKDSGGVLNGGDDERTRTFTITVTSVNDEPTLDPIADETVDEDAPQQTVPLAGISSGAANESQTLTVTASSSNTALVPDPTVNYTSPNAAGSLEYTPVADQFGTATITVTVKDSGGVLNGGDDERTRTFTITVTSVDDAPVAFPDTKAVTEDAPATTINVLANDTDIDGGPKMVASVTQPVNGQVVITNSGADLTYQPNANYCNTAMPTDDFMYTLNGGSTATVSVAVNCVDDNPVAVNDNATVTEDAPATTINVLANDTDVDNGPKTIQSTTQPANGQVVITNSGADLTYKPNANYCNTAMPTDNFTYTLNGGSSAIVIVTVTCVDDAPTAVDDSATVAEDAVATAIDVLANDLNADGGPKTIVSASDPANGTVVNNGSDLTYKPDANYCGPDSFTYTLNGGSTATVSMTVTCVDDAPTAVDDSATVAEDAVVTAIDVLANDLNADGGPKTIVSASDPANGTVVNNGSDLTYKPDANYCGPDSFTYTLNGGSTATVSMTVTCVDDAPTAVDDSATVAEDAVATAIDVLANDLNADGGPKTIVSASDPANGTVVNNGSDLTYKPDANYCGPDSFTYTLNGGSTATVSMTVTCVDDAPTAVDDSATVAEDAVATAIDVLANDLNADGGPKTIVSASDPANGTVVNNGSDLTYKPDANYCGPDSFTYTLNGGSTATVSMTVTCVDDEKPSVTITHPGQASPTSSSPITFRATFSESVGATFQSGDVTVNGTSGGSKTASVTEIAPNDGTTYKIDVTNMTTSGTVTVSVGAGQAEDAAGNGNTVSNTDSVNWVEPITTNTQPVVTITSPTFGQLYAKGSANVNLQASFVDPDSGQTWNCTINWDDGATTTPAVNQTAKTCGQTHTYTTPGVYTIVVTICDNVGACGSAEVWIVVYDPSGGFVTGGGWLNIAAGSYVANPTLTGRANFGFNSQYKKNATVPTGQTEFNFQVGDFNFHSTVYTYLIVNGFKSQFRGKGTVNGSGNYSFTLTAYDGQITGGGGTDKFRIRITNDNASNAVVFDNRIVAPGGPDNLDTANPQEIAGGSIVIHKA